jgi:hypothetical protein
MESIDQKLSELGFPNGVYIPENISRQEFDNLKVKWDQASSKLTESDLSRIVKRVISEGMEEEDPLEGHISVYNEYKDGKISKDLFYRFIGVLDRRDKERLLDYIRSEKEENESES